jgi:DNA-directed RNA polymerase sigma subunit (sigma70/sigma32)
MWEEAQAASDPVGAMVESIAARTNHRPSREAAMSAILARGVVPLDTDAAGGRSPEADFARAEMVHRVRVAVDGLPPDARNVVRRTMLADEPETLTQVGGGRGAPRMRAARTQQDAFARLRRVLEDRRAA